jgi:hypothetical protein
MATRGPLVAATIAALLSARAAAALPESALPEWRRALHGHLFIPSLIAADPFVPTAFTLATGGGIADLRLPAPQIAGYRFGDGSYRLGALTQAIAFQAGITRWLGLRVGGVAGAWSGVGVDSATAAGATLAYKTRFGLTVGAALGRFVRIALLTDVDWRQTRSVIPLDGISQMLLTGRVEALSLETRTRTLVRVLPGVSLAFAPHAALGVVGSAQVGWERVDEQAVVADGGRALLSAAVSFDLRGITRALPVGLSGAWRGQLPFATAERALCLSVSLGACVAAAPEDEAPPVALQPPPTTATRRSRDRRSITARPASATSRRAPARSSSPAW